MVVRFNDHSVTDLFDELMPPPMKLRISDLASYPSLKKVIVHSVDQMLYIITVVIDDHEHLLYKNDGRPFRTSRMSEIHQALAQANAEETVLRQQSPYDEMIGHPPKAGENTLEVPFTVQPQPAAKPQPKRVLH